ncbi:hypothetical protein ABID58_007414 [Bradyrhizobium sp. S3.2.6]|uniref:hypothetical protein n=1 Tax=Bradyrhizobium sp. S3.2.6 TaxID=3156428 RepID=UPI00339B13C6
MDTQKMRSTLTWAGCTSCPQWPSKSVTVAISIWTNPLFGSSQRNESTLLMPFVSVDPIVLQGSKSPAACPSKRSSVGAIITMDLAGVIGTFLNFLEKDNTNAAMLALVEGARVA